MLFLESKTRFGTIYLHKDPGKLHPCFKWARDYTRDTVDACHISGAELAGSGCPLLAELDLGTDHKKDQHKLNDY
jgi:hypothetical protein